MPESAMSCCCHGCTGRRDSGAADRRSLSSSAAKISGITAGNLSWSRRRGHGGADVPGVLPGALGRGTGRFRPGHVPMGATVQTGAGCRPGVAAVARLQWRPCLVILLRNVAAPAERPGNRRRLLTWGKDRHLGLPFPCWKRCTFFHLRSCGFYTLTWDRFSRISVQQCKMLGNWERWSPH